MNCRIALLLIAAAVLTAPVAVAQIGGIAGTDVRPYSVGGTVGFSAETYATSGIAGRRAPASLQLFARSNFSVLGFQSGFNLLYSTDESQVRQSMNRLGFAGSWKWVSLAAGDVAPSFSRYSLNGMSVRGGMAELTPGNWTLAFAGGQTRRAIDFSPNLAFRNAAYRRMLYGGRVGYGRAQRTHVHLIAVYARDVVHSLSEPGENNPPVQNLTLTPSAGLTLFRNRVHVQGQITASAFTSNLHNPRADELNLPWFFGGLVTPRAGTNVSYAGDADVRLRLDPFQVTAAYSRIQPGFQSLGLARIRDDQEMIRLQPQVRLLQRRLNVSLDLSRTRNNLHDHLESTFTRNQMGTTVQARLTQHVMLSGSYMRMTHGSEPARPTVSAVPSFEHVSQAFTLTPAFSIQRGETTHALALNGSYQTMTGRGAALEQSGQSGMDFNNVAATFSYVVQFASGLNLNAAANLLRSDSPFTDTGVAGINLGSGFGLLERKLQTNLNLGISSTSMTRRQQDLASETRIMNLSANLSLNYRLPWDNNLRFQLRALTNRVQEGFAPAFREMQATLRYEHRF